jgi:ADP-heptose:LPS heptosyltransferase
LRQVFSGESRIEVLPLQYARRGGLLERFTAWLELLETVRAQIEGLYETEYLVLDPDSRLTQLGVLPLVPDDNYRFFNSRGKAGYPDKASISELTNLWLDNLFGKAGFCFPSVWPDTRACRLAAAAHDGFAAAGIRKTVTLNFGVGGNDRKRVGVEFERKLVATLLREPGTLVILDLGFGEDERARSEAILDTAQEGGIPAQRVDFPTLPDVDPGARLIGVECSVAEVAAIIAQSHEFIGYDSACQHIAAAQGIRTFTIFAGTNNVRFIRRWHACGPNLSEIVYVDTISRDRTIDPDEIVRRLMDLRQD